MLSVCGAERYSLLERKNLTRRIAERTLLSPLKTKLIARPETSAPIGESETRALTENPLEVA
ncbi:MAG: hypothetical protein QOJ04_1881, partial [Caballeronia sp.]|nr:hypothetical protein [Caballeronia sp.]